MPSAVAQTVLAIIVTIGCPKAPKICPKPNNAEAIKIAYNVAFFLFPNHI